MATLYVINFTDPLKSPFIIQPYTTDGTVSPINPTLDPNATIAHTSLILYGKGEPNYGAGVAQDLVHLLENFAGPTAPLNAIQGQLWFNTSVTPHQLNVYDGSWSSASSAYVLKSGDTMTGTLTFSSGTVTGLPTPVNPSDAANKNYVDTAPNQTITLSGDITGSGTSAITTTLAITVPISKGGTGQTAKTPAFNALSPITTKGDLISFDSINNVRFPVGADGLVLTADSTQSTGLNWIAIPGGTGSTLSSGSLDGNTYILTLSSTPPSSITVDLTATYKFQSKTFITGNETIFTFYSTLPIVGVSNVSNYFEISGNFIFTFTAGYPFSVINSTGNNGSYTTISSTYNNISNRTRIFTLEAVPSAVADGSLFLTSAPVLTVQQGFDALDETKVPALNAILLGTTTLEVQQKIVAVTTGINGTFSISGNLISIFTSGFIFEVIGSTGNDGTYTTQSSTFSAGNTVITVTGTVLNATPDGLIIYPQQPVTLFDATPKEYVDSTVATAKLVLENSQPINYTLVLADAFKLITSTSASPTTFTVPTNTSVPFPIGTTIAFTQDGTGQLTIAAAGGVTIRTAVGYNLNSQYSMASMVKVATDTWRLSGDLKV